MKFWLSYLRLKTIDSISKIDGSSITFSLEIEPCLLPWISQPKLHQIKHVGGILESSWFQNCHWESNLTKNSWRKHLVANWTADTVYLQTSDLNLFCRRDNFCHYFLDVMRSNFLKRFVATWPLCFQRLGSCVGTRGGVTTGLASNVLPEIVTPIIIWWNDVKLTQKK